MAQASALLAGLVEHLGELFCPGRARAAERHCAHGLAVGYRIGSCRPRLFLSASQGVADTTRQCWSAYLSGPQHEDSRGPGMAGHMRTPGARNLVHVQATRSRPASPVRV
jgi:hypothetical protein